MVRRPKMTEDELVVWFYNQKNITDSNCWEWKGVINSGYGQLSVNGKRILAHRFSLQTFLKRPIPSTLEVRHLCNNSICINPDHLKEGTHSENMNDMVLSNRQAKGKILSDKLKGIPHPKTSGDKNGRAKLSCEDVINIKNSIESSCVLSKKYRVSKTQILRIKNGLSWKSIS